MLQETLLSLVRRKQRTTERLQELLGGLPREVVVNALMELVDRGLVLSQQDGASWIAPPLEGERWVDAPVAGWVGICPITGQVIPQFLPLDTGRPGAPSVEFIKADHTGGPRRVPEDARFRAAVREGVTVLRPAKPAGREREASEPVTVTGLVPDHQLLKAREGLEKGQCWVRVDLVPTVTGNVRAVFYESSLAPELELERPVSSVAAAWLEKNIQTAWEELNQRQHERRISSSELLRIANIATEEELIAEVEAHRARWCRTNPGFADFFDQLRRRQAVWDALEEAQRLLLIARREPRFHRSAQLAFGLLAEQLSRDLFAATRGALERWKKDLPARPARQKPDPELFRRVTTENLLADLLRPSAPHLKRALGETNGVEDALCSPTEPGMGAAVTLWLLPLFLGTESQRQAFAQSLAQAARREPRVLVNLDELITFRNECMHGKVPAMAAETADEHVRSVLWALGPFLTGELQLPDA